MESQKAIRYVKRVLGGGNYGYALRKYVDLGFWDDTISKNMIGLVLEHTTEFSYSRCFAYMFMEDIGLEYSFFSGKSNKQIIERGYLEFISLKISGISPFYRIVKAQYVPEGDRLKIAYLETFQNNLLEEKYKELKLQLEKQKLWQVTYEELNIPLEDVPLENYDSDNITYYTLLFE